MRYYIVEYLLPHTELVETTDEETARRYVEARYGRPHEPGYEVVITRVTDVTADMRRAKSEH